jgi:peptide/nickel transport system ATP-binding protein
MNDAKLLEIKGIRIDGFAEDRWYEIIKNVDLTVDRGEILGLIGESGAGKSTLGLAAMGYTRPDCRVRSGAVFFRGRNLFELSETECSSIRGTRITYVAQSAAVSFNPAIKLIDQCVETVCLRSEQTRSEAEQQAKQLFATLQLPHPQSFGDRYPHQVSGGQLQRAMIAMALMSKPDLIVFDEPTTGLDVTTQIEVLAAIKRVVSRVQTAGIYISHDLAVVAQLADRIKVLRYGEEVEEQAKEEMLTHPRESYTKSLWAVRALSKGQAEDGSTVIDVRNVSAHYGTFQALKSVSLRIPVGKTVAVVGESGSGKSTVARVLAGLLKSSAGNVTFDGKTLPAKAADRSDEQLQQIQLIYQMADAALNPRLTVRDIIGRPLKFFTRVKGRERKARIVELLEQIGLDASFMNRYPGELSGGQKQRISIARALVSRPRVIICDEITSALDTVVQEEILRLLARLQKELGIAYLFITHDIATVRAIADTVVVMKGGAVVASGTASEVLKPPYHPYTKQLLTSVPEMDPKWLDNLLQERERQAMAETNSEQAGMVAQSRPVVQPDRARGEGILPR